MYARDAIHGSEVQAPAHEAERGQMDQAEARLGFRPLALPALAAAAQARKPAVKAAALAERRGVLAIVHEDAPID